MRMKNSEQLNGGVIEETQKMSRVKEKEKKWTFFKKWANPGLFFVYFQSFQANNTILQQINVKNIHPVNGARIRTHDLRNISLFP